MSQAIQLLATVVNGMAALDQIHPNWFNDIDLDRLNISHNENCVLGQLDAIEQARRGLSVRGEFTDWLTEHGKDIEWAIQNGLFTTFWMLGTPSTEVLTDNWKQAIQMRRAVSAS